MGARVAVLMGGLSAEREVSLDSGAAIAEALRGLGHDVIEVDVGINLARSLEDAKPDVAFMALHGRGGEDGTVQGLLEIMRIPYTGCGVLASAVTMDKVVTKQLLSFHGLPVADDVVISRGASSGEAGVVVEKELGYPVMVKPASEGSSIGVTEVDGPEGLEAALDAVFALDDRALVEKFVRGRQLTVGLLGPEPLVLPVLEIITREGFYDFRAKYQQGYSEYEVPASIDPERAEMAGRIALESFRAVQCEGVSRVDLIMEEETESLVVLEVNTIPGMTETSLLPKAAAAAGIEFASVVSMILEGARLKVETGKLNA